MCKIWQNSLWISPVVLGAILVICSGAIATETPTTPAIDNQTSSTLSETTTGETSSSLEPINQDSNNVDADDPMSQVTNVSQLRDVQPGDWAYEAVRSLVERYGVISGYPDGTFQGNRSLTRYEFAAGLKVALDRISQLQTAGGSNRVTREDLISLRRLREEFVLELTLLRGRVDAVTARIADQELTQFSTTTKLNGEIIFALAGVAAGENAQGGKIDKVATLGHRSRLNLKTSFTGRDVLLTRLQAEGLPSLSTTTLTPEGDLAFTGDSDSSVKVDTLLYQFPVGKNTEVTLAANAVGPEDFANTVNPYFDGDGASGALSNFGTRHPIYYLAEGAGIGITHAFSDKLELSLGYLAGNGDRSPADPAPGSGLFNGPYGALAQLVFKPSEKSSIGLTYVHAYNRETGTGSNDSNLVSQLGFPVVSNSYGVETSFQLSPKFVLGGWAGYTNARVIDQGNANIWNWAVTLAFPDLGKKGNLAGILIGMEPKVTSHDSSLNLNDPDTSLHLEAFYQYQLTDNIAITPGLIWLTAPDHNNANADIVIGAVRTTFSF